MTEPKCSKCGFVFLSYSRQFYCCNKANKYCIICRRDNCLQCGKMINKEVQVSQCRECYATDKDAGNMLEQPQCQANYCGKCVLSKVMNKISSLKCDGIVFPCGHKIEIDKVKSFAKKFCFICGKNYDKQMDYELLNDKACCFLCVKYESDKVHQLLINCMNCGDILKRLQQAGMVDQDLILCKNCTTFSQQEQKHFSQIFCLEKQKYPEQSLKNPDQPFLVSPNANQKGVDKNCEDHELASRQTGLQKKQEVAMGMNPVENKLKKTILQKFPSEKQVAHSRLKKHMSMDTFVEKMQIQIEGEKGPIVECDECNYEFQEVENLIKDGTDKYCRLCYATLTKSEFLGFGDRTQKNSLVQSRRMTQSGQKRASPLLDIPADRNRPQFGKQSGHFDNCQKLTSTMIPVSSNFSNKQYQDECSLCKKTGEPVIRSLRNGTICFPCYKKT